MPRRRPDQIGTKTIEFKTNRLLCDGYLVYFLLKNTRAEISPGGAVDCSVRLPFGSVPHGFDDVRDLLPASSAVV